MLAIASFLQREEVRDARGFVIQTLGSKPYEEWNQSDRQQASVVCSSFDTACIFVKEGLYPQQLFFDTYGPSLQKCYAVLRPFVEELQHPDKGGSRYWDDFVELAKAISV